MKELMIKADGPLVMPDHLRNFNGTVGTALMKGVGGMFNRIGLKGNRFRMVVSGQEQAVRDENYIDVVIVGAAPDTQRVFYASKYSGNDENSAPSCYSRDGKVPAEDVHQPQSTKCDTCPQNQVGSAMTDGGKKTRAWGYTRRLAVYVVGDDPTRVFALDVKAMGLFGDSNAGQQQYNLNDFAKWCSARGVAPSTLLVRISFDTRESVPKLLFKPVMFITQDLAEIVSNLIDAEATKQTVAVTMKTVDNPVDEAPDTFTAVARPAQAAAPVDTRQAQAPAAVVQTPVRRGRPPAGTAEAPAAPAVAVPAPAAPTARPAPAPVMQEGPEDVELEALLASLGE